MQQLEYWDDRPQYTGLPEEEAKPKLDESDDAQKLLNG
jgi:hypothetical protein